MLDMANINAEDLLLGGCAEIVRLLSLIVLNIGFIDITGKKLDTYGLLMN
jgi:hypothetical protein